ncbi:SMP-30/gluconolactonase/LRE family protein [Paenibacillus sp. OAS669]|uniref:SMP-30/gluconolactonase/LRE family protein n=1 Tax=Paenibacillus sp. OAS669 TaxID=2663821 RepID=UPI0019DDB6F5|nr:SMP-30/gluconolactonase/LRE family protein [Paenibacillus sp. OAS669]MBE1443606.1 sugar lactone lactonase YvrE [Paenibacillus sp. OAS669]
MTQPQAELVLDLKATLGEGPCWDSRSGTLYWVDIKQNQLHAYCPEQGTNRTITLDQMVGAVVPRQEGGLVLALQHGFYLLDWETEQLTFIDDPESDKTENRFNDGKCDAAGRFWAGTLSFDEKEPIAALYVLEKDRRVRKVLDGITVSNGLGWSPDGGTMYYIDSPTKKVVAYDYDVESGSLGQARTVVTIPEGGGFPDGMTVDAEGMLWVAQWGGWQVSRWNPQTGEQIDKISLPAARVTSCTFGGERLDELYITTARTGLSEEELAKQPHAGGVFRVKPGVVGLPTRMYGG